MTGIDVEETTAKMSKSVHDPELDQVRAMLEEIRAQLASLTERMAGMEKLSAPGQLQAPAVKAEGAGAPASKSAVVEAGVTEEEVLAISAALAAWLGVQPHIRQIRLIRTSSWAQQGRVTIQTSHGLIY